MVKADSTALLDGMVGAVDRWLGMVCIFEKNSGPMERKWRIFIDDLKIMWAQDSLSDQLNAPSRGPFLLGLDIRTTGGFLLFFLIIALARVPHTHCVCLGLSFDRTYC